MSDAEAIPDSPVDSSSSPEPDKTLLSKRSNGQGATRRTSRDPETLLSLTRRRSRGDSSTDPELPGATAAAARHNSSSPASGIGAGTGGGVGSRGPIGPRPGVFRPCARCRVKKTKCDRLKPSCTNCQKSAGSDAVCVYDNDEPAPGVVTNMDETSPPSTSAVLKKEASKTQSTKDVSGTATPGTKTTKDSGTPSEKSCSNNNANTGNSSSSSSSNRGSNNTDPLATSKSTTSSSLQDSITTDPAAKKIRTGPTTSAAIRPSPLRTSITTAKSPPPGTVTASSPKRKTSVSNGSVPVKSWQDEYEGKGNEEFEVDEAAKGDGSDMEDQDEAEIQDEGTASNMNEGDEVVSELDVKDSQDQDIAPSPPEAGTPKADATASGSSASRSKKKQSSFPYPYVDAGASCATIGSPGGQNSKSNSGTGGSGQSKIMVDLTPRIPPPPPFVIDKNQKARRWGRSCTVFQTLGGEVSIPLWISDQEMLLNEPRPLFVQQAILPSMMISGKKESSLARLAVLNQLDMEMDLDSSERGNTPDSLEGSPAPSSSTPLKKKKGGKKHLNGEESGLNGSVKTSSTNGTKGSHKKRIRVDSGGNSILADDEDESAPVTAKTSARSTPVPQRPRTFPCSFEGCTKSFMDKFHLDRHEARHVTEEIVCGIDGCTKAYNSISTVRRHQSIMHKDKKMQMDQQEQEERDREREQQRKEREEKEAERERQEAEDALEADGDSSHSSKSNSRQRSPPPPPRKQYTYQSKTDKGKKMSSTHEANIMSNTASSGSNANNVENVAYTDNADNTDSATNVKTDDEKSSALASKKRKLTAKKARAAAAAAALIADPEVERVRLALAAKEAKDAAYRPWMDSAGAVDATRKVSQQKQTSQQQDKQEQQQQQKQ